MERAMSVSSSTMRRSERYDSTGSSTGKLYLSESGYHDAVLASEKSKRLFKHAQAATQPDKGGLTDTYKQI